VITPNDRNNMTALLHLQLTIKLHLLDLQNRQDTAERVQISIPFKAAVMLGMTKTDQNSMVIMENQLNLLQPTDRSVLIIPMLLLIGDLQQSRKLQELLEDTMHHLLTVKPLIVGDNKDQHHIAKDHRNARVVDILLKKQLVHKHLVKMHMVAVVARVMTRGEVDMTNTKDAVQHHLLLNIPLLLNIHRLQVVPHMVQMQMFHLPMIHMDMELPMSS